MSRLQKRPRTAEDYGPKSGKKRKVQNKEPRVDSVVTDENLQWREVAVPERLGNAEGFSFLEEIDHVEVIKDKDKSRTQFRVIYSNT
jgi:ATP-dependent RNA helicase DDX24/MAK5